MEKIKNYIKEYFNSEDESLLTIFSVLGIFIVVILFHAFYFNKFLSPLDGWFNVLARQFKSGLLPYRDFSFCLPPFYIYKTYIINSIFGENILNMRIYGILERCVFCTFLFLAIKRITTYKYALISVITAFIYMTSVTYDLISSPAQSSVLCSIIVLYLWCRVIETTKIKHSYLYLFLIGVFCFLTLQYKQTTGALVIFTSFVLLVITVHKEIKKLSLGLISFFSGIFTPMILFFGYLANNNSFKAYINQIFIEASGEKGGIVGMLWGIVKNNFNHDITLLLLYITVLLFYIKCIENKTKEFWNIEIEKSKVKEIVAINILMIISLVAGYFISATDFIRIDCDKGIMELMNKCVCIAFIIAFVIGIKTLITMYKNKVLTNTEKYMLVFAGLSFGILIASGLSIFFDVNITIITTAFLVSVIYNYFIPFKKYKDIIFTGFLIFTIFLTTFNKYVIPYRWWGWRSFPIKYSTEKVTEIPQLKGLTLSKTEKKIAIDVYNLSQELLKSDKDYLYSFPNAPMGYYISGKNPEGLSPFPHIDVYSDKNAKKDAAYILKNPPKIIFYVSQSDYYWWINEQNFRSGKKSGQREIDKAIKKLVKNKKLKYKLYRKYKYYVKNYKYYKKDKEFIYIYYRR